MSSAGAKGFPRYNGSGSVQTVSNIVGLGATAWYIKNLYYSKQTSFVTRVICASLACVSLYKNGKALFVVNRNSNTTFASSCVWTALLTAYFVTIAYNRALLTKKNTVLNAIELFLQPIFAQHLVKHSLDSINYMLTKLAGAQLAQLQRIFFSISKKPQA